MSDGRRKETIMDTTTIDQQKLNDFLGRAVGADNDAVYGELLGLDPARLAELRASGTI